MATKKKMLEAAAGNAGGASLDITDVFSTYLYAGDSTNPSAKVNGIDLAGEGGMVWLKSRTGATNNYIADTEQPLSSGGGATWLYTNTTDAALGSTGTGLLGFNSNGFSTFATGSGVNSTGNNYASWTFRKAPKFFDVVATWTGDGTGGRTISHNLGSIPGVVVAKATNAAQEWFIYHRSLGNTKYLHFNTDAAATNAGAWNNTTPTSAEFTVGSYLNVSGRTYVAYIFAHNNSDGTFGPDGDQDIISCGSALGVSVVNLGWEPQWLLFKRSDGVENWNIVDSMRGIPVGSSDSLLEPNTSGAENSTAGDFVTLTPTGFEFKNLGVSSNYIYMAIRRGPLAPPEAGTEVYNTDANGGTSSGNAGALTSGFPVDLAIYTQTTGGYKEIVSRLNSTRLFTNATNAENAASRVGDLDFMDGFGDGTFASDYVGWMWKRAPSFCDVVAYSGNSVSGRAVSHSVLGVAPEMIWVKNRGNTNYWNVWHSALSATQSLKLNESGAVINSSWFTSVPTDQYFYTNSYQGINASGNNYIAYLFASLDGVSKVGSYTGNGSSQTIDCGFTSGARFVLIKGTSSNGFNWNVYDTARGIVAGNDSRLSFDTTSAEVSVDEIDPHSSGFSVTSAADVNMSGQSYIFYAIA